MLTALFHIELDASMFRTKAALFYLLIGVYIIVLISIIMIAYLRAFLSRGRVGHKSYSNNLVLFLRFSL